MQGSEVTMETVDVTLLGAWITLDQWFSTRGDFASQGHLAYLTFLIVMTVSVCVCVYVHTILASRRKRPGIFLNIL